MSAKLSCHFYWPKGWPQCCFTDFYVLEHSRIEGLDTPRSMKIFSSAVHSCGLSDSCNYIFTSVWFVQCSQWSCPQVKYLVRTLSWQDLEEMCWLQYILHTLAFYMLVLQWIKCWASSGIKAATSRSRWRQMLLICPPWRNMPVRTGFILAK